MFDKNIFSSHIKELRISKNINQITLANALGISNKSISMIEKGKNGASLEVAYALADYFEVSIDYLVGRSDNPKVNK